MTGMSFAQSPAGEAPVPAPNSTATIKVQAGQILIPERTEARMELEQDVKSGADKVGDEVKFKTVNDMYDDNHALLIPAGTDAYGAITRSSRRGMFGKSGKIEFTCDYILTKDGVHVPLRASKIGGGGKNNTGAVVATVIFLSVLGVFINGRDVTIHKGQQFDMFVNQSTVIGAPNDASAAKTTVGQSLFALADGTTVQGSITSFDGTTYTIQTANGPTTIKAADVKSVFALK